MKNKLMNKFKKSINYIIIFLFIVLSCLVAHFHEPWADEAQSWLIARDESIFNIFFFNSSYEGYFPLWIIILKLFINLGVNYTYINYIPILISTIGICLIVFNKELPLKIRLLIPFSFYFFYQYNIIARNYCLFIPAFALLMKLYKYRKERPIAYIANAVFFSFISLHGMIVSVVLVGAFFFENMSQLINDKKIRYQYIISFVIVSLIYLFELIILMPKSDLYMAVNINNYKNFGDAIITFFNVFLLSNNIYYSIINLILFILLVVLFIKNIKSNKDKVFLIIDILMVILFIVVRMMKYHIGILEILILTETIIINKEDTYKCVIIYLCLQIVLSVATCYNEIRSEYSGAEEMASYMMNIENISEKNIYAIGYKATAVLPYFEKNIFSNREQNYYLWSSKNEEFVLYNNIKNIENDYRIESEYVLLSENMSVPEITNIFKSIIEKSEKYDLLFCSYGKMFFKGDYYETENYYLYKLKNDV